MSESPSGSDIGSLSHQVLVVDDDPVVGRAMESLMAKSGFRPIICTSGADALARTRPELVAAIVDIHLPDMNGLNLAQQMRATLGPTKPIVILSGDNSIETIRALPSAGATYFVAKPVNGARLIEQLKEWVRAS
jgi:DNA-binding response OmpR family regulator